MNKEPFPVEPDKRKEPSSHWDERLAITTQIHVNVTIHTSSGFLPYRNHHPVTGIPGKAYSILPFKLGNALQFSYPYPLPPAGLA